MREWCEIIAAPRWWWMLGLWVWLVVAGGIEPAWGEPRTALVIGNGDYKSLLKLTGPANDARDIAAELGRLGFDVVIQDTDMGKEAFERRVNEFVAALNQRGGVGLFYFSGHGAQVDGQNYLIPVDLPVSGDTVSRADVRHRAISADWVLDKMTERKGGINLIILDACRNEPKSKALTGDGGLAPMTGPAGTLIAYATAPGTKSADGGRNGLYTARLLEALRSRPGQEINELFRSVIRPVMGDSQPYVGTVLRTVQVPWVSSSMPEPFYFAKDIRVNSRQPYEPKMVRIGGGCFRMISRETDLERHDEHQDEVCVEDFEIGVYEVTQGQWRAVMGSNPSHFKKGDDYPVENVSWYDIQTYLKKLNKRMDKNYRLPSEEEWKYACLGGVVGKRYCGSDDVDRVAWYSKNSNGETHPVGRKTANKFDLYDMSGNVREWTCSVRHDAAVILYEYDGPVEPCGTEDTFDPRTVRGGSWADSASVRGWVNPATRSDDLGFRLARSL
ncbi:MAG: SUMF1/EgtB/PvdO family nonheme iron enzyme [Candidatus Contendobacter sp.]|nr:SUMF1/EgtB/PvdO family nonheme iron enzyme [Candidatus Contendobacter sp.]